jgi:glyoxylase-like metal-dependent hydrolase (beta-lactamase superfamily II)
MLTVRAFVFNPVQENTYVLYNEKKQCCIIDPGCYFEEERRELREFIEQNRLEPVLLVNTHCHLDHVFGNKFVHDTWGLVLHLHEKEQRMLELAPASGQMWQLPFDNYEGELQFLDPEGSISIGDDTLVTSFTPGHSPGSLSFYSKESGFVISGDVLFNTSIGRTDLPGGDYETLVNSIQTNLFTLPDDTKVYSGHGPVTTIGFEKMNNPFVRIGA